MTIGPPMPVDRRVVSTIVFLGPSAKTRQDERVDGGAMQVRVGRGVAPGFDRKTACAFETRRTTIRTYESFVLCLVAEARSASRRPLAEVAKAKRAMPLLFRWRRASAGWRWYLPAHIDSLALHGFGDKRRESVEMLLGSLPLIIRSDTKAPLAGRKRLPMRIAPGPACVVVSISVFFGRPRADAKYAELRSGFPSKFRDFKEAY